MTDLPPSRDRPWRRPVFRGVGMALTAVLALVATALFFLTAAERAARAQIALTSDVLMLLRSSLTMGLDAETGQRGYLLTGDVDYLAPFLAAREAWLDEIDLIGKRLGAKQTEAQARHIAEMRRLADAKLAELSETVALAQDGRLDAALRIVTSDLGQELMIDFRREVAELEVIEEELLEAALTWADRVESRVGPVLAVLALLVLALVFYGLSLERRTVRAEHEARDVVALRAARERSDLLARELNHRVKNLFSIILAIVSLTGRGGGDAKEATAKIRARIHALAKAHAVTQGEAGRDHADLADVVAAVLEPYGDAGDRITLEGPKVPLPVAAVTPMGLMLHELATNAAKYGALSVPSGTLSVGWGPDGEGRLRLDWREKGGTPPEADAPGGFGSAMIRQAATQLRGEVERGWDGEGMRVRLSFPVPELRTTAPAPSVPDPSAAAIRPRTEPSPTR